MVSRHDRFTADLQLWVKPPGEPDGDCGIGTGTEAGDFSPPSP